MSGHPVPQVSWLKDNMSIDSNLDYHTKVDEDGLCSLTIEETFTEDSACFTCRATNPLGFAETTALLTVRGTKHMVHASIPFSGIKQIFKCNKTFLVLTNEFYYSIEKIFNFNLNIFTVCTVIVVKLLCRVPKCTYT